VRAEPVKASLLQEFGISDTLGKASPYLNVVPLTPLGQRWSAASGPAAGGLGVFLLLDPRVASSSSSGRRQPSLTAAAASRDGSARLAQLSAKDELDMFARRILEDGRLATKLEPPAEGLDKRLIAEQNLPQVSKDVGLADASLDLEWPEREAAIEMSRTPLKGSEQLPKAGQLIASAEARALCLRKFAHHEVCAIELFAWALLRFPDAPVGFRLGLLQTLVEEQVHCKLYLERVADITRADGREDLPQSELEPFPLGRAPLPNSLWKGLGAIRASPEPLAAFLCGVGLTFEAANLDHSLKFRDIFRQAGDDETADVLQRIHDEEIRHVRIARVWLRRLAPRHGADAAHCDDAELYNAYAAFPTFEMSK
ncbi:unnamed protein product, partial [Polarella glacialis]